VGGCGLDVFGQDRDQWRALVKTVVNLRVSYKTKNVLTC